MSRELQAMWEQWTRDLRRAFGDELREVFGEPEPDPKSLKDATRGRGAEPSDGAADPEEPRITTDPATPGTYVESQERQETRPVTAYDGKAGHAIIKGDEPRTMQRGMWLDGMFVYSPRRNVLSRVLFGQVEQFIPDGADTDEPEDWRQHAKPGAVGIAGLKHPSDRGRVIEVRGLWAGEEGEDRVMWYWALDGTVSGSALTEDIVGFTPEVIWDDALSEEITEDVTAALMANGVRINERLHTAIANAILFRRPQP